MEGYSLGRGDKLTLLVILRHANGPSRIPFIASARLRGLFETDHKIVEEENPFMNEITQIQFRIEVLQGNLPDVVVNATTHLEAKTIILDRQMKKYNKDFKQSLSCALLIMNRDNTLQHLRGPRETQLYDRSNGYGNFGKSSNSKSPPRMQQVANAIFCSNSSSSIQNLIKVVCPQPHSQMKQLPDNREQDMERGYSLLPTPDTRKTNHIKLYHIETPKEHSNNPEAYHIVEQFKNSVCSVCNNRRSKFKPLKEFTYARLHDATKEGGFGSVYKGMLHGGLKIVVKQHKCASFQGEKEIKFEVNALNKAIHENMVMLRQSCLEANNRLLARPLLKERNYPDLIDERMMDNHDFHQLFWMIRLPEKCLNRDSQRRLSMDTVVTTLTHILEGNTCSIVLRDCSPAQSDSSYDMICSNLVETPTISSIRKYFIKYIKHESPLEDLSNDENKGKKPNDQGGIF
ncbi:Inactive protein kinase [Glycine soja]